MQTVNYDKLWEMLSSKKIKCSTMRREINTAPNTFTKLHKNEEVSLSVLVKICNYLDCDIGDICTVEKY